MSHTSDFCIIKDDSLSLGDVITVTVWNKSTGKASMFTYYGVNKHNYHLLFQMWG